MSTLENLVPPLELCKQIPEGAFLNSFFVWSYSFDKRKKEPFLDERDCIEFCRRDMVNAPPVYPAPTLQEILSAINAVMEISVHWNAPGEWIYDIWPDAENTDRIITNDNPASAALKLWPAVQDLKNQNGRQK